MNKKNILIACVLTMGIFTTNISAGHCMELSIENAIEMAIKQNAELAITKYGEKTARAKLSKARAANSFSVNFSTTMSRKYQKTKHTESTENTLFAPSLSISVPLYTGGKNEANIESGEVGIELAKLNTARAYENMRYNVIKAYFDVLEAEDAVKIQQDEVDKYQQHLTNTEQLYSAGSKAKIDVLRSSVELTDSQQALVTKKSTYDNKLNTLRSLLYLNSSEPLILTDRFVFEAFSSPVEECIAYAFENRNDLKADLCSLKQKELAVRASRAGYYPSLDLSADTSWTNDIVPTVEDNNYYLGATLKWNLFDSGATKADVDEALVEVEKAKLTIEKDKNKIEVDLRNSYNSMREAEQNFVATKNAVNTAEEEYFIATEKYKAGEGIMLDIIDAQTALSKARQNFMTAQYNYVRYKAALENEMGMNAFVVE